MTNSVCRRASWWDTAEIYHCVRIEEKEGYDVLIVGGEDTSTGMKPADYHDPYTNLEKWAKARWTAAADGEVVYKWTGQVKRSTLQITNKRMFSILKSSQHVASPSAGI